MRANNLLLVWLAVWILLSGITGYLVYAYLGWETIPADVSLMAVCVLKSMENWLEAAVFTDSLRVKQAALSETLLPNSLLLPVKIQALSQFSDVAKYFKLAVYIDDALTLIARIKRDISYYFLGGLLTTVPVLFSVVDKRARGVAPNLFELNWVILVPIIGILITIFRFWTPVQDMATRNEPIVTG
jgi:hypothetical protein